MSDLFGGGDKGEIDFQPTQIQGDKTKLKKKIRSVLYRTEGGALGEELEEGDVGGRDTFFGN